MSVMEANRLLNKVMLEALIGIRLEGAGVLEHPGHIAALGEEFLSVVLRRLRQGEVFPVDLDGRLALVAVGGHSFEVDNVVAGKQFSIREPIHHLVVHHQVLKKGKAGKVGIGFGKYAGAGMAFGLLPSGVGLVIEVDGQCSYRLGEDPDAGPDSRDGQRAFRGDDVLFHRIGHGVGEKHLVHSLLELL